MLSYMLLLISLLINHEEGHFRQSRSSTEQCFFSVALLPLSHLSLSTLPSIQSLSVSLPPSAWTIREDDPVIIVWVTSGFFLLIFRGVSGYIANYRPRKRVLAWVFNWSCLHEIRRVFSLVTWICSLVVHFLNSLTCSWFCTETSCNSSTFILLNLLNLQ